MSRLGSNSISVPKGIEVTVNDHHVTVKGSVGALDLFIHTDIEVEVGENEVKVSRPSDSKAHKSAHGLYHTLIINMIKGVTEGYKKELEIIGVGYRAQQSGSNVMFSLGYSKPIEVVPAEGIKIQVESPTKIVVEGIDKQKVGEMASTIRKLRPPDAYKGKGVRYVGERIRLKPGKAAASKRVE